MESTSVVTRHDTILGEVVEPNNPEGIVEGMIPYFTDDAGKNRYLSYRACGFGVHEACSLSKMSYRTIMRYRASDPRFKELDTAGLSDLRDQVGNSYLRMEWGRNFRLVLEKDRQVLAKATNPKVPLTKEESSYLEKMRAQYTPKALQELEAVLHSTGQQAGEFDLTAFVLKMASEGQQVDIGVRVHPGSIMEPNDGE